ncbi:MAG TPA: helix-turn-helix transcriptional regulator [Caldimonas sp.]|jgi:DNA-binding NarL/FixJ family response regulator|nr:helix-turn-helix transcriptional regulator [Caldimonas sp.]
MIRFALASPSPLIRAGLAAGLAAQGECEVVLSAATPAELAEAGYGGAAVVVVDVGAESDAELDVVVPVAGPHLVLLAADGDERVGEWLIDGCSVLPRGASPAEVAGAARAALAGLVATTPTFAAEALRFERIGERRSAPPGFDALTRRERQVLAAMSNGLGNREIGGVLGISAHTAKFHVAQIIAKLQAQSRAHAVAKALRAGFVDA